MTSDEIHNTDYIEYASNMMIKYFTSPKSYIIHDKEVLAKWKKEDLDQYNEATNSLLERREYLKSNNFKLWFNKKNRKRHQIIKEREAKGITGEAADPMNDWKKKTEKSPEKSPEKTPKTSPKRNLLDYTATTKGLSSLWTTMIKNKTPQKFDLMTNAIDGSLAKADTRLQAFPFHKLELFRPSKPCPIVRMFGGELSVSVHPRINRRNNGTHNICPMVSNMTCCSNISFLNMESRWNELIHPLE